jgi:hypothetical protein
LYLFNIVFDVYPLLANNQLMRYSLLKHCVINEVKKFQTLEEFNKFKSEFLGSIGKQEDLISLFKDDKLEIDN